MSEMEHTTSQTEDLAIMDHEDDLNEDVETYTPDLGRSSPSMDDEASFLIMNEDAGQYHPPPARLAARFYTNPISRRKSSATSSRRNSLSSTHSHASARSLRRHSSAQSTHIAQHLRRASIIESRKARLADRAAHAEQVRLRAALAKAAPRGNATSSEERALAAQIAREKYLAKVTAACAEEVQRAKQKAQEIKAKKLAEETKTRQDMETRWAEADRRRAEYQRNLHSRRMRRASSQEKKLAVVVEDADTESEKDKTMTVVLDDETAARRIQRTWRVTSRRRIVETFLNLNITIDNIREKSFEEVGAFVSNAKIMKATWGMLRLFGLQEEEKAPGIGTRSFLSAYLVMAHPTAVFSKNGAQEQDLKEKSQELIMLYESAVYRFAMWNRFYPSPTQCEELSQLYATYTGAFNAWKTQDSSAFIETMVASFVELDAIWQTVKDDSNGMVAADYREGIRDNQVVLLSKIRKLAGPDRADFLIKKAIRESRRRRGRRRTAAEVRPRVADSTTDEDHQVATSESLEESLPQPFEASAALDANSQAPSFASMFSPLPSNRVLTHELAVDKEFRVITQANLENRDALSRSLSDGIKDGVGQGRSAGWTIALAEFIRGRLVSILKPANSMYTIVNEALDADHITRQCEQGMFSYDKFFDFMASILPKLCAPFRDEEVKALADSLQTPTDDLAAMTEKLYQLLHFVDLLTLDYTNYIIMGAAPVLIRESAGYEQRMFAQDLDSGKITLANTRRWWRNASVDLLTEANRRDPEQIRLLADRPTSAKIYYRALVDLAVSQNQLAEAEWPETLDLDRKRLYEIRLKVLGIVCIGASLLTAKNMMKRDVRSPWKPQATRLWDLLIKNGLEAEDTPQKAFAILDSGSNMPAATKTALQAACGRFYTQAATGRLTDPVLKILFQRLKSHIFTRISASTSLEKVRAASTASELLASAGLPEFTAHVSDMVDILSRVGEADLKGHGIWYEKIAQEVQEAGE